MSKLPFDRVRLIGVTIAALLLTAACGGGGGLDVVGSGGTGIVSGSVTKGPVSNATVTAFGISNGQIGTQLATAATDANGNFTMPVGTYAGPMMMRVSGGTYKDEATGLSMAMAPGDVMTAVMPAVVAGTNTIQLTPVTGMAQALAQQMNGGMTQANIAAANAAMGSYFAVNDILRVRPMNPLVVSSGLAASQDARNYGMTLAAMSQYARSLNMSASSALVTAMMSDASDGMMDGRMGSNQLSMPMGGMMGPRIMAPSSGSSSLAVSMQDFMNSSANVSGLTISDMTALIEKLANSSGKI